MTPFTIYHGSCGATGVEKANAVAPSLRHGHCWTLQKQTPRDTPYILDNGVYSAWANDREWYPDAWAEMLMNCREKMPRSPEFVVLPDVIGDWEASIERSRRWADEVFADWPRALAVQDGVNVAEVGDVARELNCGWLFIGGSVEWKRRASKGLIDRYGDEFGVHIARPSLPDGLLWARDIGADSCDTSSIVTTPSYHHLEKLVEQQSLASY